MGIFKEGVQSGRFTNAFSWSMRSLNILKVIFVHLPPHERHKLSTQSVKCVFIGYNI